MCENPFMNSHSIKVNDSSVVYFYDGTEQENVRKTDEYIKRIKAEHPEAKVYASVKFGDFKYRVSY